MINVLYLCEQLALDEEQFKARKDELAKGLRIGDKTNEFTAR